MDQPSGRPTNRLADETSAYLRQHMHNPVDWHPWGPEALERARREDKPLLVSIGYSACHWCHVMERESFEDPETAALMNQLYVSIKVDREERPDVDQLYMDAVMRLAGHGGWPLTVFCTPDGRPFYAGTYFPAADATPGDALVHARSSMAAARGVRAPTAKRGGRAGAAPRWPRCGSRPQGVAEEPPGVDTLAASARAILASADQEHGGFGGAPKFPTPTHLDALLAALDVLIPRRKERRGPGLRRAHVSRDGAPRPLRPSRRRVPPVLRRRSLGRAALREDALRPGPPPEELCGSLAANRLYGQRPRLAAPRDLRVARARDGRLRGRLLREPGRRQRGHRGKVLRVDARRAPRGARSRARRAVRVCLRGPRCRELRGRYDRALGRRARAAGGVRIRTTGPAGQARTEDPTGHRPQARRVVERLRGLGPRPVRKPLRRARDAGASTVHRRLRARSARRRERPPAAGLQRGPRAHRRLPRRRRRHADGPPRPAPRGRGASSPGGSSAAGGRPRRTLLRPRCR